MNTKIISLGIVLSAACLISSVRSQLIINGNFDKFVPSNSGPFPIPPPLPGPSVGWYSAHVDSLGGWKSQQENSTILDGNFVLNDSPHLDSDPTIRQSVSGLTPGGSYLLTGKYASFYPTFGNCDATSFAVDIDATTTLFGRPKKPCIDPNPYGSFQVPFTAAATGIALISFRAEVGPDGPSETKPPTKGEDSSYRIDNIKLIACSVKITSGSPPMVTMGQSYYFQIRSPNATTFTTTTGQLPPGLTLDSNTGEIKGTPTACGSFSFGVDATNDCYPAHGGADHADLTLDTDPLPPVINGHSPLNPPKVAASQLYYYIIPATNATTFTTTTGQLPPGLTLDRITGEIKGRPTACGSFSVNVTAANNGCNPDIAPLTINVVPMPSADFQSYLYNTNLGPKFEQNCWTFKQLGNPMPVMSFKEIIPATVTTAGVCGLQFFTAGLEIWPFAPRNTAFMRLGEVFGKVAAPVVIEAYDGQSNLISAQTITPTSALVYVTITNTKPFTRLVLTGGDDVAALVRISVEQNPAAVPTPTPSPTPAAKSIKLQNAGSRF